MALGPAGVAFAGYDGQQIRAVPAPEGRFAELTVEGPNQNGDKATWHQNFDKPGVTEYVTYNYWWEGKTHIHWRLINGKEGSCTVRVPEDQEENSTTVRIRGDHDCYVVSSREEHRGGRYAHHTASLVLDDLL